MRRRSLALKISAWLALPHGLILGGLFILQIVQWGLGFDAYPALAMCVLLLLGSVLTLRRAFFGPAMLAAGWGCLLGMFAQSYFVSDLMQAMDPSWSEQSYSIDPGPALTALLLAIPVLSAFGVTLAIIGKYDEP